MLDEPSSNLDDPGEQALAAALLDLRQRGKTVVVISHRNTTIGVTTKLLLLKEGVVQMFGPTQEVLRDLAKANQPPVPAGTKASIYPGPGSQSQIGKSV